MVRVAAEDKTRRAAKVPFPPNADILKVGLVYASEPCAIVSDADRHWLQVIWLIGQG